jgi:hypothetical protein
MVDASDFLGPDEFEEDEIGEPADLEEPQDLAALKDSLQALADAIASTNLAVIMGVQGDAAAATTRVQSSIAALKRFHDAFAVLKDEPGGADDEDEE